MQERALTLDMHCLLSPLASQPASNNAAFQANAGLRS
jgi:hypothetical protein